MKSDRYSLAQASGITCRLSYWYRESKTQMHGC